MTRPGIEEYSLDEPLHHPQARQSFTYDVDDIPDEYEVQGVHLASLAERKRLWWRNATINTLFIASWFFFATILSVYNKWMFSPEHFGFPYPLFVTTIHMFIQFILAAAMRVIWPKRFKPEHSPSRGDYAKKAFPTAVASSLDIGLSNLSLKTITLSFYTMCKSSSLIFVLLFAFLLRLEKFSWRLVGVIFLIFTGVLLMVATETRFVLEGLLLVLTASAFGGLRWSLTQLLLQNRKMGLDNPAATIYWLAPSMGLTLAIVSAIVDRWSAVFRSEFFHSFDKTLETVFFLAAPGVLAFCMIMSEFYIIQRAGVVPMSIAGIAKEVTTITISAWFFGDQLTPLNITGVSITICGIILFTYHKYRKSMQSAVPLDGHGNPIVTDDAADGELGYHVELDETARLTLDTRGSIEFEEDETPRPNSQILFSALDGDDDADELRSIRSSKVQWKTADHGSSNGSALHEDTQVVARESIEVSRAWTRVRCAALPCRRSKRDIFDMIKKTLPCRGRLLSSLSPFDSTVTIRYYGNLEWCLSAVDSVLHDGGLCIKLVAIKPMGPDGAWIGSVMASLDRCSFQSTFTAPGGIEASKPVLCTGQQEAREYNFRRLGGQANSLTRFDRIGSDRWKPR